ncbi:cell surface glycoprotein (s-layer protein)-like protein [Anaeramoeba flamelloides]|uniref:Cell surface glycoprotein (S-layer protein)-like protein n=1 Tax=Anaeramoeba flamelloides TaxID=1746091 RepID=A0ABQ8YE30_9EUKA|nr:cell surface glycoprotein (s-layer protein)-like protein [Anaeramoeba flamelloides]
MYSYYFSQKKILIVFFLFLLTNLSSCKVLDVQPLFSQQPQTIQHFALNATKNKTILKETLTLPTILFRNERNKDSKIRFVGHSFGTAAWHFQKDKISILFRKGHYLDFSYQQMGFNKIEEKKIGVTKLHFQKAHFKKGNLNTITQLRYLRGKEDPQMKEGMYLDFEITQEGQLKSIYYLPEYSSLNDIKIQYRTDLQPEISAFDQSLQFRDCKTNVVVFKESKPIFIQEFVIADGRYELDTETGVISIQLKNTNEIEHFDLTKPLIIDPTYSTYFGGSEDDFANSLEYDSTGKIIVAGSTLSTDFPITADAFQYQSYNKSEGFIFKMNPENGELIWSTFLGSLGDDFIHSLSINDQDQPIVSGSTTNYAYPTSTILQGAITMPQPGLIFVTTFLSENTDCVGTIGEYQGFVTKLSKDGSNLLVSTLICAEDTLEVYSAIELENNKTIITGNTQGKLITDVTDDYYGGVDVFVIILDDQYDLLDAAVYGSTDFDGFLKPTSTMMVLDSYNNIIISATTNSTDFVGQTNHNGGYPGSEYSCLLISFDLMDLVNYNSTCFGGSGNDFCYSVSYDESKGLYWFAGSTTSVNLPTSSDSYQGSKLNTPGSTISEGMYFSSDIDQNLVYCSYMGKIGENIEINSIQLDENKKIILSGKGKLFEENLVTKNSNNLYYGDDIGTSQNQDFTDDGNSYYFGNGSFIAIISKTYNKLIKRISIPSYQIFSTKIYNNTKNGAVDDNNDNNLFNIITTGSIDANEHTLQTTDNAFNQTHNGGEFDNILISLDFYCPSGSYTSYYGNCNKCPMGTFGINTNKSISTFLETCVSCLPGFYSSQIGGTYCNVCGTGSYNEFEKSSTCFSCLSGTYNANYGSNNISDCIKCPQGTYSFVMASHGNETCLKCPVGTYNDNLGTNSIDFCLKCPIGTFNNVEGSVSINDCNPCPDNYISNRTGSSSCIQCPDGTQSNTQNSECINCSKGYYKNSTLSSCQKCPLNSINNDEGCTACEKCSIEFGCIGGNQCIEGRDPDQICSACIENMFMLNYDCRTCPTTAEIITIIIFIIIIITFLIIIILKKNKNLKNKNKTNNNQNDNHKNVINNNSNNNNNNINNIYWYFFIQDKIQIKGMILTFIQLIAILISFKFNWPSIFKGWFRIVSSFFILDLGSYLYQECYQNYNLILKWLIITSFPIILLIIFSLISIVINYCFKNIKAKYPHLKENAFSYYTKILKYFYLPILILFIDLFDFNHNEEKGIYYLYTNQKIIIQESDWQFFFYLVLFTIIFEIILIPLIFFICITVAKKKEFGSDSFNLKFGWMWKSYRFIYWELIEFAFKILLIITVIFRKLDQSDDTDTGTDITNNIENISLTYLDSYQVSSTFVLLIIMLLLILIIRPYKLDTTSKFGTENKILFGFYLILLSLLSFNIDNLFNISIPYAIFILGTIIVGLSFRERIKKISNHQNNLNGNKYNGREKKTYNNDNNINDGDGDGDGDGDSDSVGDTLKMYNEENSIELDDISYSESSDSIDENELKIQNTKLFKEYKNNLEQIAKIKKKLENRGWNLRSLREQSIEIIRLQETNEIKKKKRKKSILKNENSSKIKIKKENANKEGDNNGENDDGEDDKNNNGELKSASKLQINEIKSESENKSKSESESGIESKSGSESGIENETLFNSNKNQFESMNTNDLAQSYKIKQYEYENTNSEIYSINYSKKGDNDEVYKKQGNSNENINIEDDDNDNNKDERNDNDKIFLKLSNSINLKNEPLFLNQKNHNKVKTNKKIPKKHHSQAYKQVKVTHALRLSRSQQQLNMNNEQDTSTSSGNHFEFTIQKMAKVRIIPKNLPSIIPMNNNDNSIQNDNENENENVNMNVNNNDNFYDNGNDNYNYNDNDNDNIKDNENFNNFKENEFGIHPDFLNSEETYSIEDQEEITRNEEFLALEIEKARLSLSRNTNSQIN